MQRESRQNFPLRFCLRVFYSLVLLATTVAAKPPETRVVDTTGSLVSLRPAGVRGRVVSDGVGIAGVRVIIRKAGDGGRDLAVTTSDARGTFELKGLPSTVLRLALAADGYVPLERTIAPGEGEMLWVEMALRRATTLRLRVKRPDGRALADAEARVHPEPADDPILFAVDRDRLARVRAASDREGKLLLGPLDRGVPHRIVLRREGFVPQSIRVTPEAEVVDRTVSLQRAGTLRMTLRDREDRPVAGVVAEPTSNDAPDLDLWDAPEPAGLDGLLLLPGLPAGTYVLRVHAPGFRPVTVRGVEVRSGQSRDLGSVTLDRGTSVTGRVLDEEGRPVRGAGVRASFYEEGRRIAIGVESDVEGNFVVSGLPGGEVDIQVEAGGFFPETLSGVPAASEDVRVVLSRPGSITGRVLDSRSGLPVPVFSIRVAPLGKDAGSKDASWRMKTTHTDFEDTEGRFDVTGLRPQTYGLTVKARGYRPADIVEVEARAVSPESIAIRLDAGQAVEGVVLDAETGAPVSGAIVRPDDGDPVTADFDGHFRIGGLEGRTSLQAQHPRYVSKTMGDIDPETAGLLEFRLSRGGSIEGTVYGRGGFPIPGVQVILEDDERTAVADASGRYRLDGVPPGQRLLRRAEVPEAFEGSEAALVTVRQDETTVYDFGRGMRLYGAVTSGGTPASGALIMLAPPGSAAASALLIDESAITVRAREDGSYEARGLHPGTYGLSLSWEGRTIAGRQARLEEGMAEQRLDLQIPDLWLGGTIVDPGTGLGLRGTVTLARLNERTGGSSPQTQTESDGAGRFRVPLMEPGTYAVRAFAEGYTMEESLEVDVAATRDDLRLEMTAAISLVVKAMDSATGAPLEPDCVSYFAGRGKTVACGAEARLDSLRPGDGIASVYVQGYAPGDQRVELRDKRHEVTISVTRGGTLRLLLPPQVESVDAGRLRYGLRLENTAGIDILAGRDLILTREEGSAIRDVPAEHLRVRIGGGMSGLSERIAEVNVSEGAEALVDLR